MSGLCPVIRRPANLPTDQDIRDSIAAVMDSYLEEFDLAGKENRYDFLLSLAEQAVNMARSLKP